MLSWLLLAGLVMIWAVFLFPSRNGRSLVSSVEEFEERMNILAETNEAAPGRWVLMPRKGRRLLPPGDRKRARVRRRRRQVFTFLLEACGLTVLMGLFPPLRPMLYLAGILAGILALYVLLLVKLRGEELDRRERVRARSAAGADQRAFASVEGAWFGEYADGNGNGAGDGNGHRLASGPVRQVMTERDLLRERGVRVIEDGVHVVIRHSGEIEVGELQSAG